MNGPPVIADLDPRDPADPDLRIAPVAETDIPIVLSLVRELAEFEKLLHEVVATEESFRQALFGPRPMAECVIAWRASIPLGFALYFHNFSTFLGRPGVYLEDLYVRPQHRGQGVGGALLRYVARVAVTRGCGRMEWAVLNWNKRAIAFYERVGARGIDEWTTFRLTGEALARLGKL